MSVIGTRKSTLNRRRKGKLAYILPWLRRFGFLLAGLFVLSVGGAWFFMSGASARTAHRIEQAFLNATADMGFSVQNIMLEGRAYADADALRAIINIERGDPLFSFNPSEAQQLLERVEWVKRARVERRFPDTIYINVEEQKPLALWQKDGQLALLDIEGNLITGRNLAPFRDLVIVLGEGAPPHAPALIRDLLADRSLYDRVSSAVWIGNRRWDITMKNGITIKLPENDIGMALDRLVRAQSEGGILDKDLTGIDLREPDRIIVRTRPGALQEYKAGLKTGNNI
jgi:cell division protein FtsQ